MHSAWRGDRREFGAWLAQCGLTGAGSAWGIAAAACVANRGGVVRAEGLNEQPQPVSPKASIVPVVDTHTHFYDPTRPQGVPWPGRDDAFLYRPVLPAEYREIAEPLGVTGTVVVEASPWPEDNVWLLDLADKDPFLLGIVGNLMPGTLAFRTWLPRLLPRPKFLGIRVNHGALKDGLQQLDFVADLTWLAQQGKVLDVNGGPDLLSTVSALAEKLPQLIIVINHLANVHIDGDQIDAVWRDHLAQAGQHPNVYCKVSALAEGASQGGRKAPHDPAAYRPILDAVWSAFPVERLMYGSNWPVSARFAAYGVVQQMVTDYLAGHPDQIAGVMGGHAARAYRWPEKAVE
jgi:L-fuconolactonase